MSWIPRLMQFPLLCLMLVANPATASQAPEQTIEIIDAMADGLLSSRGDGTYPRITNLADGSLLGTFTRIERVNGKRRNHLVVSRSDDGGVNWTEIGEVARGLDDIDNVFPLQLKTIATGGTAPRLLAAFRNHSRDASGNLTIMRITICRSDDNGNSWSFHSEVDRSERRDGTWEPFLLDAPDGSLHVYYARERGGPQDIVMKRSRDGGRTWGPRIRVASQGQARDGMPAVVPFRDDSDRQGLYAIYESGLNGRFTIQGSRSYDGGQTWQKRELVYAPPKPFNAGAPQVIRLSNGTLVASFMTDEGQAQQNWPRQSATKVLFTRVTSGSLTWTGKYTVAEAESFWPGLLAAEGGSFYATFAQKGARVKRFLTQ